MTKVNRTFKDRLFRLVFSTREELLALYNAVNGSGYTDVKDLEITTLGDAVYMGMKNDLSFLIDDILSLYEHQSTYNPNMPLRGFLYLADVYRKYIEARGLNVYGKRLALLPSPRYLIFYNGTKEEPDRVELRLSDAFHERLREESCLEFKALMYNINLGHNKELMERCRTLREYAMFVSRVRNLLWEGKPLEEAVEQSVEECICEGILAELLSKHRAEVRDMILTEYDEQKHMEMERRDAREEGWIKGKKEGKAEGKTEAILLLLSDKGEVSETLSRKIKSQTDADILAGWLRTAARVQSVEDFEREVRQEI